VAIRQQHQREHRGGRVLVGPLHDVHQSCHKPYSLPTT
jgi:hypothetical protein